MENEFAELQQLVEQAEKLMNDFSQAHLEMEVATEVANEKVSQMQSIIHDSRIAESQLQTNAYNEDIRINDDDISAILEQTSFVEPGDDFMNSIKSVSSVTTQKSVTSTTSKSSKYANVKSQYAQSIIPKPPSQPARYDSAKFTPKKIQSRGQSVDKSISRTQEPEPSYKKVIETEEFDDNFQEEQTVVAVVETEEDQQALMTEIDPKFIKDTDLVESILADDYFKRIQNGFKIPDELVDLDRSLNEKLSQRNMLESVASVISSTSITLSKPALSERTTKYWSQLKPPQGEIEIVIPKVRGQPDFLRELQRDRILGEYEHSVDQCLEKVREDKAVQKVAKADLEALLIEALDDDIDAENVAKALLLIDDDMAKADWEEGDDVEVKADVIPDQQMEDAFKRTHEAEEKERQAITINVQLKQAQEMAQAILGERIPNEPPKRVSSARAVMKPDAGQVKPRELKVMKVLTKKQAVK